MGLGGLQAALADADRDHRSRGPARRGDLAACSPGMESMSAITGEEAQELLAGRDLIAIGARGDEERRRRHGSRTTFVRVLEVHVDAVPETLPASSEAGEIRVIGRPQSVDGAVDAVSRARSLAGEK